MSPKEIHADINTLGDESPSYSTVKKWVAKFRRGRASMEDYERSGRPTDYYRRKRWACAQSDHAWQEKKPAWYSKTNRHVLGAVLSILTDILRMPKVSARWVPRMLTKDQEKTRLDIVSLWRWPWGIYASSCDSRWDLGPSLWYWGQKADNRSTLAQPLLRNLRKFLQQGRWWPIPFGIVRALSWWIIFRKVAQ